MPGIEDRIAQIKAIQAEAAAKKTAEKEKTAKESTEKRTGLEQEKAQVEEELASVTAELQDGASEFAKINNLDLSDLDSDPVARGNVEKMIADTAEELNNLNGRIHELTKRKQEIDKDIATLNIREEAVSAESPVETSAEEQRNTAPDKMEEKEESAENKLDRVIADADVIVDSFPIPKDWQKKIKDVLKKYIKDAKEAFESVNKYITKGTKIGTLDLARQGYLHEMLTSPAHEKIYKKYQSPDLTELAGVSKKEAQRVRDNGLFNEQEALKKTERQFWGGSDELSKIYDMAEDVTSKVRDILNASIK